LVSAGPAVAKKEYKNMVRIFSSDDRVSSFLHMMKALLHNFTGSTCQVHKKKSY
jgi:hypothetical protein